MYYKIRRGMFETNSSSSHSVTIRRFIDPPQKEIEVDSDNYVHAKFEDFGWGFERISDSYPKLQYLLTMVWHCAKNNRFEENNHPLVKENYIDDYYELDDFKAINEIIKERCNCDGIIMDAIIEPEQYGNEEYNHKYLHIVDCYGIDHQSSEDYKSLQQFLDEYDTSIEDFIFDDNVVIKIDNDNCHHDDIGRCEYPDIFNDNKYSDYEYYNGTYEVSISRYDGTKIRKSETNEFIPKFAESIDVNITQKCNGNCPYCYAGCTPDGKHADYAKYEELLDSIHRYTEIALNVNDLSSPDLMRFIVKLHSKSVFVNITINEKHFIEDAKKGTDSIIYQLCTNNFISGLGISLASDNVSDEFINIVKGYSNAVVHVICGLVSPETIDKLMWNDIKVLILGYKDIGRGTEYYKKCMPTITAKTNNLIDYFKNSRKFNISFDNLALKQLDIKNILTEEEWNEVYMGDDGEYTFYMNLVDGYYAKSSLSIEKYPIDSDDVAVLFQNLKNKEN